MKEQLFTSFRTMLIAILAAAIVMIVHELCKAVAYKVYIHIYNTKYDKAEKCPGVFRLYRYIDPIGIIFAATSNGIFSKQYPFVIRSRKASFLIGLIGYLSIIGLFGVTIICYRIFFGHNIEISTDQMMLYYILKFIKHLLEFIAYFSATLFVVNIYPIATFDISLLIATNSPSLYLKIRKYDMFFKLLFLIFSVCGFYSSAGIVIASKCLGF